MNRHKKAEDPKNALLAMYLGYVELYRPKYFLLENVNGLLYNKVIDDLKTPSPFDKSTNCC